MAEIEKNNTGSSENTTASMGFTPMSGSDMEKQRKSRKKELIAAAIGEGISSLSNLFFASKGAPAAKPATAKQRQPTLMERIYGRHKEEDRTYNANFSAWEKEQEKKRKEAEANAREEIHADFKPLKRNWNDKDYITQLFTDFESEVRTRNRKNKKDTSPLEEHLYNTIKSTPERVRPYLMQTILYGALDGSREDFPEDTLDELDDEFLNNFRKKWAENDTEGGWVKMK